jgi:pimeloyl-ACP methyl ester carboxylesterase
MSDFVLPVTQYALRGDVNIAYQTTGDGPLDLILVPGIISHVEFHHEFSGYTDFLRRLSKFSRVVTFDKRGQGLSDRITGSPSLEQRIDDVRAIMDDIGSRQAVLMGFSECSPMSALFAAKSRPSIPLATVMMANSTSIDPSRRRETWAKIRRLISAYAR